MKNPTIDKRLIFSQSQDGDDTYSPSVGDLNIGESTTVDSLPPLIHHKAVIAQMMEQYHNSSNSSSSGSQQDQV